MALGTTGERGAANVGWAACRVIWENDEKVPSSLDGSEGGASCCAEGGE
jgi:hypothetical protein